MVPYGTQPALGMSGVNFLIPFAPEPDAVEDAVRGVRVGEFFYGDPRGDLVQAVHRAGALAGWQVGSAAEAEAAVEAGCDYVVAQGIEAGGHIRGKQPLDEVLTEVLSRVQVPVVAAGAVATSARVAELIGRGAAAVRVGTRFVASVESGAHPDYVQCLLPARAKDTTVTTWFGEGWDNAPHRVLRSALEAAHRSGWRATVPPYRGIDRDVREMAMYAGMGVGDVTAIEPAASILADLVSLLD
jgi:NAD(P)H-dependent flavin oxidoreductase YrpB (nitropropane dioxygenase family)